MSTPQIDYDRPARRIRAGFQFTAFVLMLTGFTLALLTPFSGITSVFVGFVMFVSGVLLITIGFMLKSLAPIGKELADTMVDNESKLSRTFWW